VKYQLYAKEEAKNKPPHPPSVNNVYNLVRESENFEDILSLALIDYQFESLSDLDIRIKEENGNQWHLSIQEICKQIEDWAEDYANLMNEALEDLMNEALEEDIRFDAECPSCGKKYVNIRDPKLRVCGECSGPDNEGPRLEKVNNQ